MTWHINVRQERKPKGYDLAHGSTSRGWSQLKCVVINSADPTRGWTRTMRRQRGRVTLTRMHARSCVKIEKELTLKIPPEDGYVVPYMQASRTEAVDRCLADGAEGT